MIAVFITCAVTMRILSVLLILLLILGATPPVVAQENLPALRGTDDDVEQAAQILGVQNDLAQLRSLSAGTEWSERERQLRQHILRRVLLGSLEVRRACNKIDLELAYTYALMQKHQRRQDTVNQMFTLANFLQFGILYSLEGQSRILEQFKQSAIIGCVSAGVGTALPLMDIFYNKISKAHDVAPPKFLAHIVNGGPVDGKDLPPLVARYMDSSAPGETRSRREQMYERWRTAYGVNPNDPTTLVSLVDGRAQSTFELNRRIILLWSLHTYVQGFDRSLLALLRAASPGRRVDSFAVLEQAEADVARVNSGDLNSPHRLEVETDFLSRVLEANLDVSVASDKIDEELNYAYDVALAELLAKRGAALQKNFQVSFIQNGVFGAVAGLLYLKARTKAGNEMHLISSSIGALLSTVALREARGGKRKRDTAPNSLAQFMHLDSAHFSPFIEQYLDQRDPQGSNGRSRRDELIYRWKHDKIASIDMNNPSNRAKVAAMPAVPYDRIKILRNRIALLTSIQARISAMQRELVPMLVDTTPKFGVAYGAGEPGIRGGNNSASSAAVLLGVDQQLRAVRQGVADEMTSLAITRSVEQAALELRSTVATADMQIAKEAQMLDRMTRARDLGIALTNNLNFFQINILGIIIDGPLGITTNPTDASYNNHMTIMSGLIAIGLASGAFLERHGGYRPKRAEPNMLGPVLGIDSPAKVQYYPIVLRYLDTVPPDDSTNMTRRQQLIEYWKTAKLLNVKINSEASKQKIAATGRKHHVWDESIKLIGNRITMLYDLRAIMDLMDIGLSDLIREVDAA